LVWFDPGVTPGVSTDLTVNQDVFFATPMTFGQQMSFGLYAVAFGSNGSFGSATTIDTSIADFADTITWEGINDMVVNGGDVSFGITSGSGIDWTVGLPEPASMLILAFGAGATGWLRRRRR
jgi:hypothetical protein